MKKIHVLWMLLFLVLSTSCVSVNRLMKGYEQTGDLKDFRDTGIPPF